VSSNGATVIFLVKLTFRKLLIQCHTIVYVEKLLVATGGVDSMSLLATWVRIDAQGVVDH
jgi:hypothetical protein